MLFEPKPDDELIGRGIAIGKCLVRANDAVPVRLLNANGFPVHLKKGTPLGCCSPVSSVVRTVNASDQRNERLHEKLSELVANSSKGLNREQQKRLRVFMTEYQDIFDVGIGKKGRTNVVRHKIHTGDVPPIRQPPRKLPLAKREEANRIIKEMEEEGVIEQSASPWPSPVVLVKKKDGSTRFCVDYRQLNNVTLKDSYPLPRIDDTLDTLAGSKVFFTLDLKSGYWQVEMDPRDKEKTAFTVGSGLWQFTVMPFGLCNAPATFERLMETVLKGLSWETCLVYLDDIIVVEKSFDDHLKNLEQVFRRLRQSGLKLSPKKCHLFQKKVQYLGHVVSQEGIAVDPQKIEAVKGWPVPKNKHDVRSFLGLCTYYRRYVAGFATIAKPLTGLTEEGRRFQWGNDCQQAFDLLKKALSTAPVLSYPLPTGKFVLDTDASNVGIGSVLLQIQDGREVVIGYFSKTLSKPERNYCVTRRELLAIVKSVEHFYKYLYRRKFLLRTDHASLTRLLRVKNPEGQVARWIERLQEFDFDIEHRAGESHGNADAFSRRPCPDDCAHCNRAETKDAIARRTTVVDDRWQRTDLQKDQEEDPSLKLIIEWKREDRRPSWQEVSHYSPTVKSYWAQWDSLVMEDGILRLILEDKEEAQERRQTVVPRNRVAKVLGESHSGTCGGHLGVAKTLEKVRERFYWFRCKADVKEWCRKCTVCAASNGPQRRKKAPMRQYNVGSPFERIAIDVAGPFPESEAGNKYIVVIDYFSKWVEAYALPNQEAATVADALVKDWICRFGVPLELHSDQGRNFESALFQNVCKTLGIRKTRTTALHPQSDGMVERMNRTKRRGLSPKLQNSWEGPYEVVKRINDVIYRIKKANGGKPRVVHFNRLAPFAGDNAEAQVRELQQLHPELNFEDFMATHTGTAKARFGVTREEHRDLFTVPDEYALAHCAARDLRMPRGIASEFQRLFGQVDELKRQGGRVGQVLELRSDQRRLFYLISKGKSYPKPTYRTVWEALLDLREKLLTANVLKLAIPKLACGRDGLDWRIIRNMLEVLFRFTGIEILVCSWNPRGPTEHRTVDCFFYQTSGCKKGVLCPFRHERFGDETALRRGQCPDPALSFFREAEAASVTEDFQNA
ncbi:unnamed protein product [Callosobruchus maculatus]|uniref:RNA-directed DNA polymerase n=1 Tax=Callosobruchus maculatus TaxID=64391 RepID=A0A653C4Y8_CALMS|nr:unnamed protein product [Callosobruchus maculatus]